MRQNKIDLKISTAWIGFCPNSKPRHRDRTFGEINKTEKNSCKMKTVQLVFETFWLKFYIFFTCIQALI